VARIARAVYDTQGDVTLLCVADAVVKFVGCQGGVSFVELASFLEGIGFPVRGDRELHIASMNVVLWSGISPEFVELVDQTTGRLEVKPTSVLVYLLDGGMLSYPVAKQPPPGGYRRTRWLPVVFNAPKPTQAAA
jgi:hypothetical protein